MERVTGLFLRGRLPQRKCNNSALAEGGFSPVKVLQLYSSPAGFLQPSSVPWKKLHYTAGGSQEYHKVT